VLATVVRYFGGVKLGAGGLVRAYTDAVAQALLGAEKLPLRKIVALRCAVPYSMEGLVRREVLQAGAVLGEVAHGDAVDISFAADQETAPALMARLNEAGQGALRWLE
jgi:putative IMPACT (imprinted ancient) family translation regulator